MKGEVSPEMHSHDLSEGWSLRAVEGPVPDEIAGQSFVATVPGTVHVDLMAAGMISDPFVGLNESAQAWMHRTDWRYERKLWLDGVDEGERVDLVFDGIDTVATVSLDGVTVGHAANMHRPHRFDVREQVAASHGTAVDLVVDIQSALVAAEAEAERIGARPTNLDHPFNMVRKMACSFGWDWGPDLQTAGVWGPVHLERWHIARLASVRPLVRIDADGAAHVTIHVDVEWSGLESARVPLAVEATLDGAAGSVLIDPEENSGVVEIVVPEPELWWPVGYGDQPLYDLDLRLSTSDSNGGTSLLGAWHRRIGLRTVSLDVSDDELGGAFTFVVNGQPVFAKGANWIPDDHLLTRITRDQLARRIDQAVVANMNMLRVWGGGIFESEDFYDLCDERGIMVWQDFLLACAAYPEEEPHRSEFEAEARFQVARLSSHPSLVLWNGGNENLWGHEDWGWKDKLGERTWGSYYYEDLFPRVVAELDPTRPYTAGSPASPGHNPVEVNPNDPNFGSHHEWEVWNAIDYVHYRDDVPRFCSEFGFQGPPTWATLSRAVRNPSGEPLSTIDPVFLAHQKAADGGGKLDRGLAPHLGVPDNFADWHWATQLNQARAVAFAITHYRSWWPRTAGSLVWQFNDCWPVTSWAAVDGDERLKPLWWAVKAAYSPRLLTFQSRDTEGSMHEVIAVVNDAATVWTGNVEVRREKFNGTRLASAEFAVEVPARSVSLLDLPVEVRTPDDPREEVLVARLGDATATHCWMEDVDLRLDPDPLTVRVEPLPDGYRVHLTVMSLVKDLVLHIDRLDPEGAVDQSMLTLPAGASCTIRVTTDRPNLEDHIARDPVLRTANDLARTRPVVVGKANLKNPSDDESR